MIRRAALALAAAVAALGCTGAEPSPCPGAAVGTFRFKARLVGRDDPRWSPALDPVPSYLDCTPDPLDPDAPIRYPIALAPFDGTLAADGATGAAALCRPNGVVLEGERTGASSYAVEASAESAVLCDAACAAALRVIVAGDVVPDPGGGAASFSGVLVEVLAGARGTCDACLPAVPATSPPERACAARYVLSGAAQ